MVPQSLGNGTERGYYIFFDIKQWQRERVSQLHHSPKIKTDSTQREFTLIYDDLENLPARPPMV